MSRSPSLWETMVHSCPPPPSHDLQLTPAQHFTLWPVPIPPTNTSLPDPHNTPVCWSSSIRVRRRMDRLVRRAGSVLRCPLDSVEVVGSGRMMAKLSSMLNNTSHPLQDTMTALGSSFSEWLLHPRCVKERYRRSFLLAAVYVEFDDQEWEKREWVKVYEDFQLFLLEYQLVWAKKKEGPGVGGACGGTGGMIQGTKAKHIQWPALAFKPVVGKSLLKPVIAVEFLLDRQLDFLTDNSAYQPYQDELDSQNPVLRDNHQLHEEVKCWLKEQKVQEIFLQGPYSLNGYRVRVYRQDSATQWFTGIITHHDLFSRNMVVMNDQVLEPQNVDPSMIQMTFLDDVVHSLLKGENIGITSRRRSRSSQNNNAAHVSKFRNLY
ncbi:putative JmjC domain-containing histone demethylation protein 2C [Takifugu flavidus]|uniref:Putative JmjC domain-containing histone demethylation protein 2C n=1 Tax=Takifugu flavidus TaxID=433684 RepID=A0A5C6PS59_9TELE|nr:putative JmjC domain-containing histone demethylation protein 2C [Takifugu flavidus]